MLVSSCILASELLDRRKKVLWMKERLVSKRYSKMQIIARRKKAKKRKLSSCGNKCSGTRDMHFRGREQKAGIP